MRAKPSFTLVTDPEKTILGDILVIPHEREVKKKKLHFKSSRSLSKLGAIINKHNAASIMDVFTDAAHTRVLMVTSVNYKYVRDAEIFANLTNSIGGSGYVRPVASVELSALSSRPAIVTFSDIIKENLKEAKVSKDCLSNSLDAMGKCDIEPHALPYMHNYVNGTRDEELLIGSVTGILESQCSWAEATRVTTPFMKAMLARGAKIIRPANRAAKEAFTMHFLKEQHLNTMLTSIDMSITNSMKLIKGLRDNIKQVRKTRTWWKKFFTDGASQKASAFEAAARISGTKKEDVLWR